MHAQTPRPGWTTSFDARAAEAPLCTLGDDERERLRAVVHRALDRLAAPDAPASAWAVVTGWATPRFSGHGKPLFIGDLLGTSEAEGLACMVRVLLDEHPVWGGSPLAQAAALELQLAVAVPLFGGALPVAALAPLRARLDLLRRHFLGA